MMKDHSMDQTKETLSDILLRLRDEESPLWVVKESAFLASERISHFGYHPVLVLAFENAYLHSFVIFVHGKDEESATKVVTMILNRQDDIFDTVTLLPEQNRDDNRMHLPFSCHQIQSILQTNPQREYKFENFELTEQQAWTLSSTDISTQLSFLRCRFVDGGRSFCVGSTSRSAAYQRITFEQDLPFYEDSWHELCRLLDEGSVEHVRTLSFRYIAFDGRFALSSIPNVEKLSLECCFFDDLRPLQHLIKAVASGRVKHTLVLSGISCDSFEVQRHYELLLEAVGRSDLQQLDIVGAVDEDDNAWLSLALIRVLERNNTLKKLVLGEYQILGDRWQQLLKTATQHPHLLSIECETMGLGCEKEYFTKFLTSPFKSLCQENQRKIQVLLPSWILENDYDIDLEDDTGERISCPPLFGGSSLSETGDCISEDCRSTFIKIAPTGVQGDYSLQSMLSKNIVFDNLLKKTTPVMPQLDQRLSTSNLMQI